MKTMNTTEFASVLERAAKIKGAPGVTAQKKLILENYMIVDEAGMAVDPETLDVVVKEAAPAIESPAMEDAISENAVAKSVRKTLSDAIVDRKWSVAANIDSKSSTPWETARVYGSLKNLKSREVAWKFGTWCAAALGHAKSREMCKNHGLELIRTRARPKARTAPVDISSQISSRARSSRFASSTACSAAMRRSSR